MSRRPSRLSAAVLVVPWLFAGVALLGLTGAGPSTSSAVPVRVAVSTPLVAGPNIPVPTNGITVPRPAVPGSARPAAPGTVSVNLPGSGKPSQTIVIILLLTVLSVAPALLVLVTSFTKMIVVLSLLRNALGTPTIPPNQVLAGLALFLSLFVMSPVLSQVNEKGIQPYLKGDKTQSVAFKDGSAPLHTFMLKQTRQDELATMVTLSKQSRPATSKDVSMTTLIPAFVLSELKSAFIIGFVIFIPFLIIDLVVSSSLMSMGMMMLPPVLISLPFKLLLFVMIDGWDLVAKALVQSYS